MQIRPIVSMGLALAALAGCQSYFPNSYGGAGPYSAFPQGGYGPPPGSATTGTTFQPGRNPPPGQNTVESPPLKNKYAPANGPGNVPNPREAGGPPASLGTPLNEDGQDTIRHNTGSLDRTPARLSGLDETDETLAALGDDNFAKPIESASGIDDGDEIPRRARKPGAGSNRPNPYKYDKEGYTWLRGTVSRDEGGRWRLRYSDNALAEDDKYGGTLELVGDEKIERLIEDEVIMVRGRVDPLTKDAYGKPSYRVESLDFLKPKAK